MQDYEKLGAFYLGRQWDPASGKSEDGLVLYDSKDLVTHAVCFGMTGSGKTGLCIAMMEEAAIDGVPVLVIDPKGDISNLLLTFPDLSAEEFLPWINEDDARIKGVAPEEYARQQAELWKKGLAAWGQDESRIRQLRDSADFAVYTPGQHRGFGRFHPEILRRAGASHRRRSGVTARTSQRYRDGASRAARDTGGRGSEPGTYLDCHDLS